jgi:hypothetical protein
MKGGGGGMRRNRCSLIEDTVLQLREVIEENRRCKVELGWVVRGSKFELRTHRIRSL